VATAKRWSEIAPASHLLRSTELRAKVTAYDAAHIALAEVLGYDQLAAIAVPGKRAPAARRAQLLPVDRKRPAQRGTRAKRPSAALATASRRTSELSPKTSCVNLLPAEGMLAW